MNLVNASQTPHVRSEESTRSIMLDVIIALLPATIFGVYSFGVNSLIIIIATILSCIISETVFNIIMKKENTISDLSCVVTGLILALNMPPECPAFIPVIGGVFAIIVVKMLFGGLGQNFMNPALGARCFLLISFAGPVSSFMYKQGFAGVDVISEATPLAAIKAGQNINLVNAFIGNIPGTIGEISTVCLLIGAIYLIVRKVIDYKVPVLYIVSFMIFLILFGSIKGTPISNPNYLLGQLLGGGLIFGAFFMATDYVTIPLTPNGKILFGLFLGFMTAIFRVFGKSTEGVSYAIIIGNMLVPFMDMVTIPKAFGKENKNEKK